MRAELPVRDGARGMSGIARIQAGRVARAVRELYGEAACVLPEDVASALEAALRAERSPLGCEVLRQIVENARVARRDNVPICQDTGMAVVFVDLGQDVHIEGGDLNAAIDEGVRAAVRGAGLRASTLTPLERKNFGDNTPAVTHVRVVPGNTVKITVAPKGFGSENMSGLYMLNPSDGEEGVIAAVVDAVRAAGGNPCPPVIVGVGIGGTAELAMLTAKRGLLRKIGSPSPDERVARMEEECLRRVNALDIGPMGLGGDITALAVHIAETPTHIAALPVAINMQCHCARHASRVIAN